MCLLFYLCVSAEKRRNNEWVGVKVRKKSSRRLEVAAHLGIGSGAGSRDRGRGEVCGFAEWEDV